MRCLELPGRQWAQLRPTLPASAETLVFSGRCFLSVFDANQPDFLYEFPTIRIWLDDPGAAHYPGFSVRLSRLCHDPRRQDRERVQNLGVRAGTWARSEAVLPVR